MSNSALIQLALSVLDCNQKELAQRLNVSPAQVSKWKNGDYMSYDMQAKLSGLIGIEDMDPDYVVQAGSVQDAQKWMRLLKFLAEWVAEDNESGYHAYLLEAPEEETLLCWKTFNTLKEMGVDIPQRFPEELDFEYEDWITSDESEKRLDELFSHSHVSVIIDIYKSYTDVYGFYAAYVSELIHELDLDDTSADGIESELLSLAASKLKDPDIAKNFQAFKRRINNDYIEWLNLLKKRALEAGQPLRAELLDLVYGSHDSLGHNAEAESLGFNDTRLHPDIYMNELLIGMRVIHQVLPAILKKLGIEEEFKLDASELHLK
jgi:transcriptional regulator with XRE-family HTH domain